MHVSTLRCAACGRLTPDKGQAACENCGGTLVIVRVDVDNGSSAMVTITDGEPLQVGERFEVKVTLVFDLDPRHKAHELADAVTARLADEAGYIGEDGVPLVPSRLRVSAVKHP